MKALLLAPLAVLAVPAQAQIVTPPAAPTFGLDAPLAALSATYDRLNGAEVPYRLPNSTGAQRRRLAQAIALREEALRLQAADGGVLSARNRRHIRRKAERIRAS